MKLSKSEFSTLIKLYPKQPWLVDKEDQLLELMNLCDSQDHKELLTDLLENFNHLELKVLDLYLKYMADYIINKTGYSQDTTQIAVLTADNAADSSQKVLDFIKMPLFRNGWGNVETVNSFSKIPKQVKKGRNQIVLIDEFIGSGKTLRGRLNYLAKNISQPFDIKICYIAGMRYAIDDIKKEFNYDFFCPLIMNKGISENYSESEIESKINAMSQLESKLACRIGEHSLESFSMGYNFAEALYSSEQCLGNTPNSVFPIFWWPRFTDNRQRVTLFTRMEKGLK